MYFLISFLSVVILSIGNFFPFVSDDYAALVIKTLVVFCLLIFALSFKDLFKISLSVALYFCIVSILTIISSFNSLDLAYALDKFVSISIVVILLFMMCRFYILHRSIERYFEDLIYSALIILLLTFFYKVHFGFWDRQVRFFLNGPIVFAWLMGFYSLVSLFVYSRTRKKLFVVFTVIFMMAVIWAETKGALLALLVAITFYSLYGSKKYIKMILGIVFFSLWMGSDFLVSLIGNRLDGTRFEAIIRFMNNDVGSQDMGSITVRQDMFNEGLKLFFKDVYSGIGLGSYKFYTIYGFPYPHNVHLEVFMEAGVFVGSIYLLFIAYCLMRVDKIFKCFILFFAITGSFSGDMTYLRFLFFVCLIGLFQTKSDNVARRLTI